MYNMTHKNISEKKKMYLERVTFSGAQHILYFIFQISCLNYFGFQTHFVQNLKTKIKVLYPRGWCFDYIKQ